MNEPVVLVGGFGSNWHIYQPFGRLLARVSGRRVFITTLTRITWLVASAGDYKLLVTRLHHAVMHALAKTSATRAIIVGHSAGGVVARAYLGDTLEGENQPGYRGHERIMRLITLGSPLTAANDALHAGLRHANWIDSKYPGAFYAPDVQYLAVIGRFREGKRYGHYRERRAYRAYEYMSGNGAQWGDGVVPVSMSTPDGIPAIEIDGVSHSPVLSSRWYGADEAVVSMWWSYFDRGDAPSLERNTAVA